MISVIVPAYNVENYIERCLKSILCQTYTDLEIVVVDDGSTDGTSNIINEISKCDQRIIVIHQENKGLSGARNTGIDLATGDYLFLVDSDDFIHPKTIEVLFNNLIQTQADVAVCGFQKFESMEEIDITENVNEKIRLICSGPHSCYNTYVGNFQTENIVAWNKLYKTSLFKNVRYPEGKINEDEFITYKILYQAKRVVYLEAKLYFYFQRMGSIMNPKTYGVEYMAILEAVEGAILFFEDKGEEELAKYAAQRAVAITKMVYNKYNEVDEKKLKRVTLRFYRRLCKDYKNYWGKGLTEVIPRCLYGVSPKYAERVKERLDYIWEKKHER